LQRFFHGPAKRERIILDAGGEFIMARRADDRRARRRFKATLKREQRAHAAEMVAAIVVAIGPIHGLFARDSDA